MINSIVAGLGEFAMDFNISTFLSTLEGNGKDWAGYIVTLIGLVMMIAGIWKVGKGFISDKAQTNWVMAIGAIVLGGMLLAAGITLLTSASKGVADELNTMGGGFINWLSIL